MCPQGALLAQLLGWHLPKATRARMALPAHRRCGTPRPSPPPHKPSGGLVEKEAAPWSNPRKGGLWQAQLPRPRRDKHRSASPPAPPSQAAPRTAQPPPLQETASGLPRGAVARGHVQEERSWRGRLGRPKGEEKEAATPAPIPPPATSAATASLRPSPAALSQEARNPREGQALPPSAAVPEVPPCAPEKSGPATTEGQRLKSIRGGIDTKALAPAGSLENFRPAPLRATGRPRLTALRPGTPPARFGFRLL